LKKKRNISIFYSVVIHAVVIFVMMMVRYEKEYPAAEYVEIGFGELGMSGSAGAPGSELEKIDESTLNQNSESTKSESTQKEIDISKTKNTDPDNIIKPVEKSDKEAKEKNKKVDEENNADKTSKSIGNKSPGEGSFGYDISWGGRGKRNIYFYVLPAYPPGVNKEIDIRLRFTILSDGTVGTVIPLIKADTRLEEAAINSLRRWKFEPLRKSQDQGEQTAVIVFPYRLE